MSKARVIVLSVVHQGLTKAQAARKFAVSWQWVHTLVTRFEVGGLDALEPRSRRPIGSSARTPDLIRDRIIELRQQLTTDGLDAGPITIAWHLEREAINAPAISTIRRILVHAGLVTPQPAKRPKSSYLRFAADQPNETWQSDFTHWALADGTDIEILNWLDDHSRLLLSCTAHHPVTGTSVIDTFTSLINEYGPPASTLTDNGSVYTARFRKGRNSFEHELRRLNIVQKNGHPNHPQTQGKVERFQQTMKKALAKNPPAATLEELQNQLDAFRDYYNTRRPHRSLQHHQTPAAAYAARPKATPSAHDSGREHNRIRRDIVDKDGRVTLRHDGKMHHIGIGRTHARTPVLMLIQDLNIDIIHATTGEILRQLTLDTSRNYQPQNKKSPQP